MAVIVQKYGGTSVADPDRIRACAERTASTRANGHSVVVVVSAMGHTTDHLIELAHSVSEQPSKRELDMLMATGEQVSTALMAMALQDAGVDAVSVTGGQAGILTDDVHAKARIRTVEVDRLRKHLDQGKVIVAAGFQGVTDQGEITTLGRGGSDTTAVALAAALGVGRQADDACEIYTDVDGIYTADPRKVKNAHKLDRISYEEMLELASLGAGVMHNRAVMFGSKYHVPIHVRHSQRPDIGTMIVKESPDMEARSVVGCALTPDLGRVSIRRVPNRPGTQARIFNRIAEANVLVDDIMQTEFGDTCTISFTVDHADLADVKSIALRAVEEIGVGEVAFEIGLAKVSAVGLGMRTHTGVAAAMFRALGDANIHIANVTTSEIKVSCIIPKEYGIQALQLVHDAFGLAAGPAGTS